MAAESYRWGIDLGGTKIEVTVLNAGSDQLDIVSRERIPTEADQGYEHIIDQVSALIRSIASRCGHEPVLIGVGHPGVISPATRLLKNSNTQCLNGRTLQLDLERALGCRVACANDANCFALAEALYGAGAGSQTVFGVILGTGVGGGVVINKQMLSGRQGIAGEWGHNVLAPEGEQCYCGKRGCVETVISGPALERHYFGLSGTRRPLNAITEESAAGVPDAQETIQYLTDNFGRAIASVINILDPDSIVLGGGVSNIEALYSAGIEAAKRHIFNSEPDIVICKHQLGDSAGVIGAALLS